MLVRQERLSEAQTLFKQLTSLALANELVWLWLSVTLQDNEEKKQALQQVLRINPANKQAVSSLASLDFPVELKLTATAEKVTPAGSAAQILVVSDLPDIIGAELAGVLTKVGYRILTAEDVFQAVAGLNQLWESSQELVQLIICDVSLPFKEGLELFKATRNNEAYHKVPFVFRTFAETPPDVAYRGVLYWPVSEEELSTLVKGWLE